MKKCTLTIQELCFIAIFTAVLIIMAQIIIPMPSGVPMTMQTFAVMLAGIVLGPKYGTIAVLIYLCLGAAGIPVFTGLNGGLQALVGPTGGFLLSFPFLACISGYSAMYCNRKSVFITLLSAGNILNLIAGMMVYSVVTGLSFKAAFLMCVLPFLPATILKIILSAVVGLQLKKRLRDIITRYF